MDDKSKKGKGADDSATPPPHRGRLKFKPNVPRKKALEIVPKMEPQEESKSQTMDKNLLVNLNTPQSSNALQRRAKAEAKVGKDKDVHLFNKSIMSDFTTPAAKLPKECAEPQDYNHTNYNYPPVTLPLRRPYSRDPELIGEDESGQFSSSRAQDGELTVAEELGLMATEDVMNKPQLLFFQFPASLPLPTLVKSVVEADMDTSEDVEIEGTQFKENGKQKRQESICGCRLKDLPGGCKGKVLVYKSGKLTMRLGDALFDVSAGLNCAFAQEAVAINIKEKHCCSLGEVSKRAIVTPDIDYYLLDPIKME